VHLQRDAEAGLVHRIPLEVFRRQFCAFVVIALPSPPCTHLLQRAQAGRSLEYTVQPSSDRRVAFRRHQSSGYDPDAAPDDADELPRQADKFLAELFRDAPPAGPPKKRPDAPPGLHMRRFAAYGAIVGQPPRRYRRMTWPDPADQGAAEPKVRMHA
jgi:hypothetical protein